MSSLSDRAAVKRLLRGSKDFFQLVHQFNALPASYAHQSWFDPPVAPGIMNVLLKSNRGKRRLSELLLARHGLKNSECYDFDYRWRRFALLPGEVLQRLALLCGLAFNCHCIAAIVDKAVLDKIKNSIDERAYLFAVKRAPLIVGQLRGIEMQWDGLSDFGSFAQRYGATYFLSHFNGEPAGVASRLAFKFDCRHAALAVNKGADARGWQVFKRILLFEIDRGWQTLFS